MKSSNLKVKVKENILYKMSKFKDPKIGKKCIFLV